ncbi:hypothetical protein [Streptomyces sp. NPDC001070]
MSQYGNESEFQHRIEELEQKSASAARLFDVRRVIGGLFVVYGLIVTIAGITASDAAIAKAEGININLWAGIGMLVLGLLFLLWMKLSPPPPLPPAEDPPERGSHRPGDDG